MSFHLNEDETRAANNEEEVEKTIHLGRLLGVDLQKHRVLVQDAVSGKGVQGGIDEYALCEY